jgi:type 1 fimbria pilin
MKRLSLIMMITTVMLFVLQGCEEDPGPNGNAHIHGTVVEHSDDPGADDHTGLSGSTVFIWYGQTTEDGDPDDMSTTNASGTFDFENMSKGDYFLRAEYIDDHDGVEVHLEGHATVSIEKKAEEVEVVIEVEEGGH